MKWCLSPIHLPKMSCCRRAIAGAQDQASHISAPGCHPGRPPRRPRRGRSLAASRFPGRGTPWQPGVGPSKNGGFPGKNGENTMEKWGFPRCGMKNGMKNGILMLLNGIWWYLINIILTMKHDKWEPNWAFNGLRGKQSRFGMICVFFGMIYSDIKATRNPFPKKTKSKYFIVFPGWFLSKISRYFT